MDDLFPETLPRAPGLPDTRILIGTSGYSFHDWVGPFYPPGLSPAEFLPYYARHFSCVEVNATYYRIPDPATMARMERKTPPGFRFVVKLHQSMTHDRALDPGTVRAFLAVLEPLKQAGKYDGLLAQFPWGFRCSPAGFRYLDALRQALPAEPLFVEFRHRSWLGPELEPWLREHRIGFCAVDEPQLSDLMPPVTLVTAEDAYVRFHGRNARTWWSRSEGGEAGPMRGTAAGRPGREISAGWAPETRRAPGSASAGERQLLRYDYSYSEPELGEWMSRIRELAEKARRTYLFFNNRHAGQAARSAKLMQEMLRQQKLAT